ncbi:unnamed protein product [Alternaria alternata]
MFNNLPEDMLAYTNRVVDEILAQDPNGLDPSASSIASRFTESSSPRRRQETAASSPSRPLLPRLRHLRLILCSQESKSNLVDGERVYMKQPNGTLRWAVLKQQARGTLAARAHLNQMVEAVGGDPATFRNRLAKADYVLAREAPTGVVREEDSGEMFSLWSPVHLGQPASNFFWGTGQFASGTLTMAPSTQEEMEWF